MPLKSIFTFFRAFFRLFFIYPYYNSDFRFLYGWRVRQFMTLDLAFYAEKHVEHFSMADNSYICFFGALKGLYFFQTKRGFVLCYQTVRFQMDSRWYLSIAKREKSLYQRPCQISKRKAQDFCPLVNFARLSCLEIFLSLPWKKTKNDEGKKR